jgi:ribose transport system ATP-binding protein
LLRDVDLTIAPGEVHGLLGQNGSGKSTLIKILAGYHAPDGGTLEIGGEPVELPVRPADARHLGLSFVHQDLALVNDMTVMENLRVGRFATNAAGGVDWRQEARITREALTRFGVDVDPGAKVGSLPDVERALVAIVRALHGTTRGGGVLVLDEPTVFLPRDGVQRLFAAVRDAAASGVGVLLVSHRLEEIKEICDTVTVLRDGALVGTVPADTTSERELVEMILGRSLNELYPDAGDAEHVVQGTVRGLTGPNIRDASFDLRTGEIIGLTGLAGMGWEEIPYLLFGAERASAGEITIDGRTVAIRDLTPRAAMAMGIALLPANRARDSGLAAATLVENVTLPTLGRYFRRGQLRQRRELADVSEVLAEYQVVPPDPRRALGQLSGGNQQKALVAKWLRTEPRLLLLHEPTQGVDIGSREQLFRVIRATADAGCTVIIVSGEHEDLAHLCDRVLICRYGSVATVLEKAMLDADRILEQCYLNERDAPERREGYRQGKESEER